jgi:hypothetical protein
VAAGEPIVAFQNGRDAVVEATHIRSTAICSAILALRGHGLYDRYVEELEPRLRDAILPLSTGEWVPIELGVAHYDACDRLALEDDVIRQLGAEVGRRVIKNPLSVIVTLAHGVGAGPWTALSHVNRYREAAWRGSEMAVWKLGPKEARVEWEGQPCARIRYFRIAFAGFMAPLLELFCQKAYVLVMGQPTPSRMQYRVSWV